MTLKLDYLDDLNPAQRAAVVYNDGPSLVIAGAGSGKTRVLTYKTAYLLQQGMSPYRVLALTFTNKAAKEMKMRIASVVGKQTADRLWMGTFHSVFLRILRAEAENLGFTSQFTIYDTYDSKSLIKNIVKTLNLDDKIYKAGLLASKISLLKNRLITPVIYENDQDACRIDYFSKIPQFKDIYNIYMQRCKASNAMDFDDLLLFTNILFRDFPEILKRYQDRFDFLLIDEYQDVNFAQHLIVTKLAAQHKRVCAVGDDAQSIYSFRGANVDNILNFRQQYADCRLFKLEQNYRSTKNIVSAANSLIDKNSNQIKKHIYSENKTGLPLSVIAAYSDFDEAFSISGRIMSMISGNAVYSDFAILYRTNAQSRVIEESLRKLNLPYKIYGGLSFYQRKEIKDLLAYFRLTINKNDEEALRRIINYPARGIGDTSLNKLLECAHSHNVASIEVAAEPLSFALNVNSGTAKKLIAFAELIGKFAQIATSGDAYASAETIVRESGILDDLSSDDSLETKNKKENIEELLSAIHEFCDRRVNEGETDISLADYLSEVSLLTDQDNEKEEDKNKITLMTIHSAKGLEFKHVFVTGLEEQLFPSSMCQSEREIEEERRLFYVAVTRAMDTCTLSYAKSRFRNGQTQFSNQSRFLKDIGSEYLVNEDEPETIYGKKADDSSCFYSQETKHIPKFKKLTSVILSSGADCSVQPEGLQIGTHVSHSVFGLGIVLDLEGEGDSRKAKIEFEKNGVKQLLLKYAKIIIIDGQNR